MEDFSDAILMLIANNEIGAALATLIEYYKNKDQEKYAELIFVSSRLKQIEKDRLLGLSNNIEYENKILMLLIQSARDIRTSRKSYDDKKISIQITINKDINELNENLKNNLVLVLATILNTNLHDIEILNTTSGSIIFTINLPYEIANMLIDYFKNNTFHIKVIDKIFKLTNINVIEQKDNQSSKSFEQIFQKEFYSFIESVYAFCYRLTNDPHKAEVLTQETYMKAWRFIERYEPGTNAKAWLFRIAHNTFINDYRRNKTNEGIYKTQIYVKENIELEDSISKALNELDGKFRTIVLLDLEDFSYQEISALLNLPIGTVRSRLHRARNILAKKLREYSKGKEYNMPKKDENIIEFIGRHIGEEILGFPSPNAN